MHERAQSIIRKLCADHGLCEPTNLSGAFLAGIEAGYISEAEVLHTLQPRPAPVGGEPSRSLGYLPGWRSFRA
jgi:hypothetical protein